MLPATGTSPSQATHLTRNLTSSERPLQVPPLVQQSPRDGGGCCASKTWIPSRRVDRPGDGRLTLPVPAAAARVDSVYVDQVLDDDYKVVITRSDESIWLLEYGIGCLSLWRFEGRMILISSPGTFAGVGSRLVLPNDSGSCRIWDAELLNSPQSSTTSSTPTPATSTGSLTIWTIDGAAMLIAGDGAYLGYVSSNPYSPESFCNPYGSYGSAYASKSVRNRYGSYGNHYATYSAYNEYTSSPPAIVYLGTVVGYLTKNSYMGGAVDPDLLFAAYQCHD